VDDPVHDDEPKPWGALLLILIGEGSTGAAISTPRHLQLSSVRCETRGSHGFERSMRRFADDRLIPRFHLEGVEAGRRVSVFKIDPGSGERLGLLATATVGEGGWVDLPEPIVVRAGEGFIAVPEPAS